MLSFTRITALLLCFFPQLAFAHTVEGIGRFYAGMLHSLLVPSHTLALLTFSLLVGQRGVKAMRYSYPAFLFVLAVALILAGFNFNLGQSAATLLLSLAAASGLLVSLNIKIPLFLYGVIATAVAFTIGLDSGVTNLNRKETALALLGCWIGDALLLVFIAGAADLMQKQWQRLAIRIAASWATASAILVLSIGLR